MTPAERPPLVSDGVSINQSTGEATAIRVDTGNQVSDAIQNGLAPVKASTWNAFREVGKWWSSFTIFSGGALGEVGAAAALSKAGQGGLLTTVHGAQRLAGAGATRGGVLSAETAQVVLQNGRVLTQTNGARVHIMQNAEGRFNIVVSGERGIITTFQNISQKSFDRLGKNYGWH